MAISPNPSQAGDGDSKYPTFAVIDESEGIFVGGGAGGGEPVDVNPSLIQQDVRLAEVYAEYVALGPERLDPIQVGPSVEGATQVDVLAELADEKVEIEGLVVRSRAGRFVTGRVPVEDLTTIVDDADLRRLQAVRPVSAALDTSVSDVRVEAAALQAGWPDFGPITGRGVVVGIVDFGCDFRHPNFRDQDGRSRIAYLWDQRGGEGLADSPAEARFHYGREFEREALNRALDSDQPYRRLGYAPAARAHGTHVMDIAAGSGSAHNPKGVAPEADIIFVHLGLPNPALVEESWLGNSARLAEAVDYIFTRAQGRPVVVNLSLGTYGGPHDGETLVENFLDELLTQPERAVVIAAGNAFDRRIHARHRPAAGESVTLAWEITQNATPEWLLRQELEIWYGEADELELEIIMPDGQRHGPFRLGQTAAMGTNEVVVGRVSHQPRPGHKAKHINVFLDNRLQADAFPLGTWQLVLSVVSAGDGELHAWIERNDAFQSGFAAGEDTEYTLASIANAERPLVVGAYDASDSQLYAHSGSGPSRHAGAAPKPDVSAPGQSILAASATGQGTTLMSGTSMAAPHVTGILALLFQAARLLDPPRQLDLAAIRQLLKETARKNPPEAEHDARYGFGRVDGTAALEQLLGGIQVVSNVLEPGSGEGETFPEASAGISGETLVGGTLIRRVLQTLDNGERLVEMTWLPDDGVRPSESHTLVGDVNEHDAWQGLLGSVGAPDVDAGLSLLHLGVNGVEAAPYFSWLPHDHALEPVHRMLEAASLPDPSDPGSGQQEYDECRQQKIAAGSSRLAAAAACVGLLWV